MEYQPIENYGVIGDLHTVALVGMDGSIDFMCFPHFDSPSIFAALLDRTRGGKFQITPVLDGARQKQIYLPDSNILLSRFLAEEGVAEIADFMPVATDGAHRADLFRIVKTVRGEVRFRVVCAPKFDYGRCAHTIDRQGGDTLFLPERAGLPALRLRSPIPLKLERGEATAEFTLRAGETASFVLEDAGEPGSPPMQGPEHAMDALRETLAFWRSWIGQSAYRGRWREMVNRSALTLKLLTSKAYGSIVAAPTFGLPERIGGERNWDYRFTWIRDASFTLYGLIRLGYTEEAEAFMRWVEGRCGELNPDGSLQVMYRIDGRHLLTEETLHHFEGYRKSSPVRIGNGAYGQLQLDIYGELMDAVYLYDKYGEPTHYDLWSNLVRLIDWVCRNWRQPDEGIWEVRGGRREFLYSRLMCWVAVDRAVRLALKRSLPGPLDRWIRVRNEIYQDIFDNFWHPGRQALIGYKGGAAMDAAALLMPLVRFVAPRDPRWLATLREIERELVEDSHVFRYRNTEDALDGLQGIEGTFTMCSFWYVECLARAGRLYEARFYFEKMLGYANHLGLYSEELGPSGEHLGNYPQAFTHLGLISAAYSLDRSLSVRDA
ncbi:MAG: glycoside hydrolase family 15 protein [Verrucomicrobiota bacterium]